MIKMMPFFNMMIGVPGSGKSTYINEYLIKQHPDSVIISSDNYIEKKALEEGKSYSEVFQKYMKDADTNMYIQVKQAVNDGKPIIWDQTNLTIKSRAKKLSYIPKSYWKVACYIVAPPMEELQNRLNSRPGKFIPDKVMKQMIESFQKPELSEGFHVIGEVWNE